MPTRRGRDGQGLHRQHGRHLHAYRHAAIDECNRPGLVPIAMDFLRGDCLEENAAGANVQLTADDLRRIADAFPTGADAGDRYSNRSAVDA